MHEWYLWFILCLRLCWLQVVFEIIGDIQLKKRNHNLTHVHSDRIKLLVIQILNITTRKETCLSSIHSRCRFLFHFLCLFVCIGSYIYHQYFIWRTNFMFKLKWTLCWYPNIFTPNKEIWEKSNLCYNKKKANAKWSLTLQDVGYFCFIDVLVR